MSLQSEFRNYFNRTAVEIEDQLLVNAAIYIPEWTNKVITDPLMFIMRQFAILSEVIYTMETINFNEVFFRASQLESSIFNFADMIGYKKKYPISAETFLHFEFVPNITSTFILEGSQFSAFVRNAEVVFETSSDVIVLPGDIRYKQTTLTNPVLAGSNFIIVSDASLYNVQDIIYIESVAGGFGEAKLINQIGNINPNRIDVGDAFINSYSVGDLVSNTVRATHGSRVIAESLGLSSGLSNQIFNLQKHPVSVNLVTGPIISIVIDEGLGPVVWNHVERLLAPSNSPTDKVFSIEIHNAFTIVKFGDGIHGKIPNIESPIVAIYRFGSGNIGNVPINAVTINRNNLPFIKNVRNVVEGINGDNIETVEEFKQNISNYNITRSKAVTAEDFNIIIKELPEINEAFSIIEKNLVRIIVVLNGFGNIDQNFLFKVSDLFKNRTLAGYKILVERAVADTVDLELNVVLTTFTSQSETEIALLAKITAFFITKNLGFGDGFYVSDAYNTIRDFLADGSLVFTVPGIIGYEISKLALNGGTGIQNVFPTHPLGVLVLGNIAINFEGGLP